LKASLLATHTLSNHEKLDVLYKSEPLDGRKLFQMLASMLAYCPSHRTDYQIKSNTCSLQHLPVTLQTLLGEQEPYDISFLAARVDKLWATHKPQSHNLVASVDIVYI
jgi:hypothetical protein